jgi:hypothetical protein
MLSKTHEEGGIKTVTLARGSFTDLSPPAPPSLSRTTSPDAREKSDPLKLLGSVGIVELLEQDGRPTFIVDIGDQIAYSPESASLQILFANNALRSDPAAWQCVSGNATDSPINHGTHTTPQFCTWLLSTASPGNHAEVNPPPIEYGGVIWSCYTLRKRLRVVSGAAPSSATVISSTNAQLESAILPASSSARVSANKIDHASSSVHVSEPQDYFGSTIPTVTSRVKGEPTPPISAPQPEAIYLTKGETFDHNSAQFPKPNNIELPSAEANLLAAEESSSFANECVIFAHSAADVDPFVRNTKDMRNENHDMGFFDWTRLTVSPSLPRHIQFARSIDWASTPLGPIELWSNDLRAMCNLIM